MVNKIECLIFYRSGKNIYKYIKSSFVYRQIDVQDKWSIMGEGSWNLVLRELKFFLEFI